MNVAEVLRNANSALGSAGLKEPQKDVRLLLCFAIQRAKEFLFTHPEYELTDAERVAFDNAIGRRAKHEPVQYITGTTEFYGLEFSVSPAVLIPRPETEILVENAIAALKAQDRSRLCEIGVGSGCISISMLAELPNASAIAVDLSTDALEIAHQNAVRHNVFDRLDLRHSDIFDSVAESGFDAVVSNPPYISLAEVANVDREVREFEPEMALTDHSDGLDVIKMIIAESQHKLRTGGVLFMEIGHGQSSRILSLLSRQEWTDVRFFPDLQSIPRVLQAFRR